MKSETMRRMDAMKAAGLTPDLIVTCDTLTARAGKAHLIVNQRWIALYNSNPDVRAAYDADINLDDYFASTPEITITRPTIITPQQPAAKPITQKTLDIIDIEPEPPKEAPMPVPEKQPEAPTDALLISSARQMAMYFNAPHDDRLIAPEDGHLAWVLTKLADALEKKE